MEKELLWKRLRQWQSNLDARVTRESYLNLCEQLNEEPDPEKIPPEMEDFPEDVQYAIATFNKLGDKIVADVGYMGKDYTTLPLHLELIQPSSKEIFLETLLILDEILITKSAEEMRRARDKLKSKTK